LNKQNIQSTIEESSLEIAAAAAVAGGMEEEQQ